MNEWEAKYKALLMGIDDEALITNAETIVRRCIELSRTTAMPFARVLDAMFDTLQKLRAQSYMGPSPIRAAYPTWRAMQDLKRDGKV